MSDESAWRLAVTGPMQPGPGRGEPAPPGGGVPPGEAPPPGAAGLPVLVSHLALPSPLPRAAGLSLSLAAGQLLILSGRSGCGKTTVLRALAGELPTEGRAVLVGGLPPGERPAGQIVLVARGDSPSTGTVWDNFRLADPDIGEPAVARLLAGFGLAQLGITATTELGGAGRAVSGGEARRLSLAQAVARRPRLLLLDEPIDGLDPATAATVLRRIRGLLPRVTIVAAIHDEDLPFTAGLDGRRLCLDHAEFFLAE
jgi:ATP-binding cassette, subfamily C, bacterial CydC